MTITNTIERVHFITGLVRALVRHRMSDTEALLSVEEIDDMTTNADRAFILRLLRVAAPLYPLPNPMIVDEEDR